MLNDRIYRFGGPSLINDSWGFKELGNLSTPHISPRVPYLLPLSFLFFFSLSPLFSHARHCLSPSPFSFPFLPLSLLLLSVYPHITTAPPYFSLPLLHTS
jgi:prepilin signal peptidase PulO-like enzyme (type II secretory pathway)